MTQDINNKLPHSQPQPKAPADLLESLNNIGNALKEQKIVEVREVAPTDTNTEGTTNE